MPMLNLTPDELLTTTRSVRKRLDFSRPVEPEVVKECLALALQAPTGGNRQGWQWMVVTDLEKRKALAEFYRRGWEEYLKLPFNQPEAMEKALASDPEKLQTQMRVASSARYLVDHLQDVPVLVVPCIRGRLDGLPANEAAGMWGSILPAVWSFMLAARSRGLGSAWTTFHLAYEREAAAVLGIPYEKYTQTALIPVAYSQGTDFKPAPREPLERVVHWNEW